MRLFKQGEYYAVQKNEDTPMRSLNVVDKELTVEEIKNNLDRIVLREKDNRKYYQLDLDLIEL